MCGGYLTTVGSGQDLHPYLAFEGDSNVFYFEGSYSEYEENKIKRLGNEEPKRVGTGS